MKGFNNKKLVLSPIKDHLINSKHVLTLLRNYYKTYKPKRFLFEGQYGGEYSIRSVQAVFKNGIRLAEINGSAGIHSLRHSYAAICLSMVLIWLLFRNCRA